jgi:hypothetical protein
MTRLCFYATAFLIFFFCVVAFYLAPVRTGGDSAYSVTTAFSLLHGQWGDVSDFTSIAPHHYSLRLGANGRLFSLYPVGPSLFAMPVVVVAQSLSADFAQALLLPGINIEIEAITASFWCAIAAMIMFMLASEATESPLISVLAVFIFAFCSPVFSTATRALWQHGPVVVCTVIVIYLLRLAVRRENVVPFVAVPIALAFICRPLAVTMVIITTAYVARYHRRQLMSFILIGAAIALVWMAYNWKVWGSVIPFYYLPGSFGQAPQQSWFDRLFGSLISPSRGLLVFSPVFILSVIGPLLKLRSGIFDRFDGLCLSLVAAHILLNIFQPVWWAGHSIGSRYMTDVVPQLVYLMLPTLQTIENKKGPCSSVAMLVIFVLSGISLLINSWVVFSFAPNRWNATPTNIDALNARGRLWSWTDLQFLRGTDLQEWNHPLLRALDAERKRRNDLNNTHVDLRLSENGDFVTDENWSTPEPWGRWTTSRRATLSLYLSGKHNLAFSAVVRGLVSPSAPRQSIWIEVNGCRIGSAEVQFGDQNANHIISGVVPTSCIHLDGHMEVAIGTDRVFAPTDIGVNSDRRHLAVGVVSIQISPI